MVLIFCFHAHPPFLPGAAILVDAFFVMSAFLITALLVREHQRTGRLDLLRFYQRRGLRLLPAVLVVLPVSAALAYWALPADRHEVVPALRSAFFYYANFRAAYQGQEMSVFLPTWSLSTEEQFYVVWPSFMLLLLLLRVLGRWLVGIVAGILVAQVCWLQWSYLHGATNAELVYRPDFRISGILIGTLLGLLNGYGFVTERWRTPTRVATAGAVLFTAYFLWAPTTLPIWTIETLAIVTACVGFAALVLQQVRWPVRAYTLVLENRVVLWLGQCAYVLYLAHVPALRITGAVLDQPPWPVRMVVGGVITLAVGAAVHELVEKPALRLKARRTAHDLASAGA
jgi:peptidoglycan/LPS O-acetylase OafA/YrhL